jgi:F-type H+-transporting ATPase subunit delta
VTSKVARRYAKAIFEYLSGSAVGLKVADELEAFGRLIENNREARIVLVFGLVSVEKRKNVVSDMSAKMGLAQETQRALSVLTDAGRLGELLAVADRLRSLISAQANVILMDVKTAEPLDAGSKTKVEAKFEKILNSKVEARYSVDDSLLGGLHVSAAGRSFDGSVAGMLGTMQEQFSQGEMQ